MVSTLFSSLPLLRHQRLELAATRRATPCGAPSPQFAVHGRTPPPLLELYCPQSVAQPFVKLAPDSWCLRQPEVGLLTQHVQSQPLHHLVHTSSARAPAQLPDPMPERCYRLGCHRAFDAPSTAGCSVPPAASTACRTTRRASIRGSSKSADASPRPSTACCPPFNSTRSAPSSPSKSESHCQKRRKRPPQATRCSASRA